MWLQFLLSNLHFAINLRMALVVFAVFWLYYDAWTAKKNLKDTLQIAGFLLLAISFLIQAVLIETGALENTLFSQNINHLLVAITRIPAYILIILSQIANPIQKKPTRTSLALTAIPMSASIATVANIGFLQMAPITYPFLAATAGILYLRKATTGLENHLKPLALFFYIFSFSEILSLTSLFQGTNNIAIYNLIAPFGPLWIASHVLLFIASLVLSRWVFGYLLKRFQTQLFMVFTTAIVVIFVITTVAFTSLLLKNLQDETLSRLETDAKVLSFALESKKEQSLSDAQVFAQNPEVVRATLEKTRPQLAEIAQSFLITKKESLLLITSESGQVLVRGEDKERFGDSLSDDPLIKRALLGQSASSIVLKDAVITPEVSIRSATPIKSEGKIIGTVMTGTIVDNAAIDGIKNATNLEASVYAGNQLSATSLVATDGKTRAVGIKEENKQIKEKVLARGENYLGSSKILNVPYFAAYLPLKDVDNNPVGMIAVAKPQVSVLKSATRSIELTFIITVLLIILSVIPSRSIANNLTSQIK